MVNDTGSLDLARIIADDGTQSWVLANVVPGPNDGHFVGVTTDAVSGLPKAVPGSKIIQVRAGLLKLVATLAGEPEKETWDYRWDFPVTVSGKYLMTQSGPSDLYLPFLFKNTVICRINKNLPAYPVALQNSMYYPVYVLPPTWGRYCVSALRYYQSNVDLFKASDAAQNKERLWKLSMDENPLLAVAAFRILAQMPDLDQTRTMRLLRDATGVRQAVLTDVLLRLMLVASTSDNTSQSSKEFQEVMTNIDAIIASATGTSQLNGLAWGLCSYLSAPLPRFVGPGYSNYIKKGRQVYDALVQIQGRVNGFGTHAEVDAEINHWLRAAGVPQRP